MNLPSRGLRLSATTMRNTGSFFAPTRFIRILTAIKISAQCGGGNHAVQPPSQKSRKKEPEISLLPDTWQVLFWVLFLRENVSSAPPLLEDFRYRFVELSNGLYAF